MNSSRLHSPPRASESTEHATMNGSQLFLIIKKVKSVNGYIAINSGIVCIRLTCSVPAFNQMQTVNLRTLQRF